MKTYTLTWGWKPPQYELTKTGLRVFFHFEEMKRMVEREDMETGETTSEEITEWLCDVVEYDKSEAKEAITMIRENPNSVPCQKWLLKARIKAYDKSRHVEDFSINGIHLWLGKDTRTGLMLRFQAEKAKGKTETVLWHDGMKFPLVIDMGIQMLYELENYASETYDNTAYHLSVVDRLSDVTDIKAYINESGYPEKLEF